MQTAQSCHVRGRAVVHGELSCNLNGQHKGTLRFRLRNKAAWEGFHKDKAWSCLQSLHKRMFLSFFLLCWWCTQYLIMLTEPLTKKKKRKHWHFQEYPWENWTVIWRNSSIPHFRGGRDLRVSRKQSSAGYYGAVRFCRADSNQRGGV